MRDKLQRAIDLSRRTGDRLIVYDMAEDNDPFVVIPADQYERLSLRQDGVRNLSEEGLTEKINRDIAIWKSEQDEISDEFMSRADAWRRPARRGDPEERGFSPIGDLLDETSAITDHLDSHRDRYLEDDWEGGEDLDFDPAPLRQGYGGQAPQRRERFKRSWGIPERRREAADEVIEEDRQYLEEVPF
jgi:hypothetical protein